MGTKDYFGTPAVGNITDGIIRLEMVFCYIEIESFLSNLIQMERFPYLQGHSAMDLEPDIQIELLITTEMNSKLLRKK